MKLIGKHCNTISSYKAGKVTFDDLIQEGYIATLKAIGAWTFDNALTTVIGLYIPFEMKRFNKAFGSIVRPPFNRKDSQNIQIISLDCLVSTNADSNSFLDSLLFSNDAEINYENNVIKTLDYASLKDSIKKLNMTKTEKQIVSLWLNGTNISKIAKSMCLSRQYIDIKIKEIKNGAVEKRDRKPFSLRGTIKTKAKDKNNSSSKDNDKSLITHVIDTSGATHTDIGTCKNKVKKTQKILYKQHIISKTGLSYTTLVDILNKFGIHRGRKYFTRK
jgi:DNA-directed RNA polymerase sigma subunit (sigma70/sigma32)